jgi:hypothetical protein
MTNQPGLLVLVVAPTAACNTMWPEKGMRSATVVLVTPRLLPTSCRAVVTNAATVAVAPNDAVVNSRRRTQGLTVVWVPALTPLTRSRRTPALNRGVTDTPRLALTSGRSVTQRMLGVCVTPTPLPTSRRSDVTRTGGVWVLARACTWKLTSFCSSAKGVVDAPMTAPTSARLV